MQIITVLTQAMEGARRKFSRGEQGMLIDIFNGTALTAGFLGQHLGAQVEDSFILYPGMYEEKWGVKKTDMLEKIASLSPLEAALVELWAVGFWALGTGEEGGLEAYLTGKISMYHLFVNLISEMERGSAMLEKTKTAFRSASVGEARQIIATAIEQLEKLL